MDFPFVLQTQNSPCRCTQWPRAGFDECELQLWRRRHERDADETCWRGPLTIQNTIMNGVAAQEDNNNNDSVCPDWNLTTASGGQVANFYEGASVFVTGGTGFVGKALVEKLLRSCPGLQSVFLLIRPKRGKDIEGRYRELLENPVSTSGAIEYFAYGAVGRGLKTQLFVTVAKTTVVVRGAFLGEFWESCSPSEISGKLKIVF